jgi:hypothetical protein
MHRRGPRLGAAVGELRRLRAELAAAIADRDEWRGRAIALADAIDHDGERAAWSAIAAAQHRAELTRAYADGRSDEAADNERAWRINAGMIVAQLDPASAAARELADRHVRAAEAGCRRDAAEHERSFAARAYATPDHARTPAQRATVYLYPPAATGAAR